MATHSSTLAWKIPWMEEPGRLQSMGSLRVRHDWATSLSLFTFHFHALEKEMATHCSVLAWRIPGTGEPGGLLSVGSHRVGHDWSDLAAAVAACTCHQARVKHSTLWSILVFPFDWEPLQGLFTVLLYCLTCSRCSIFMNSAESTYSFSWQHTFMIQVIVKKLEM